MRAAIVLAMLTVLAATPATAPVQEREHLSEDMLRFARVGPEDVVYDFGSVESVPIVAAERFGARGRGVALDAAQVATARKAAREHGVEARVRFIEGNLLTTDLSDATVVTLDLTPDVNLRLEPMLRQRLRPGTRIVSHRPGIGDWRPEQTARARDGSTLLLWTVPRPPARTPDIFFVPTEQKVVEEMLQFASVDADDVVYDLGSGDGRIVILAATEFGAHAVGVELDPALVETSRQVARGAQVADKVRFVEGDLFEVNLSEATVVTLFLSPTINLRLEGKLKRELKNGARVVSHQFDMGHWRPDRTMRASDGTTLFLWTIKK
jgi:predicted RNA methylase